MVRVAAPAVAGAPAVRCAMGARQAVQAPAASAGAVRARIARPVQVRSRRQQPQPSPLKLAGTAAADHAAHRLPPAARGSLGPCPLRQGARRAPAR